MSRSTKARLLSGVGTTVFAALMAGGAYAAETTVVDPTLANATASGQQTIDSLITNVDAINAAVSAAQGGLTVTGDQTGTTNTVTENVINANATANTFNNTVDLSLINDGTASPANDGIAALGVASNASFTPPGGTPSVAAVTSSVVDSSLALDLTGFQSGTAVNSDNTIQAATTVNAGTTSVAGTIPNGYTSATEGTSAIDYSTGATNLLSAAGTVVATSVQGNQLPGGDHSATVTDNSVSLSLLSTLENTVDTSPTLDGNTIDASLTGNTATSTIDIQEGGAPTFTGSAVLTNLQGNVGSSASAANTGSTIAAGVEGDTTGNAINTLNGGLSVQGNTISSAATGNRAGSNGTAGNRILIGDTMSVAGAGTSSPAIPGSSIAYDNGDLASTSTADFVIQSSQGNVDGPTASPTLTSTTSGGQVTAFARSLNDGSITLAGNDVTSQTVGNTASSALMSGADAAAFDATVAVSNQQANDGVAATATTSGATVTAVVAPDDGGPSGGVTNQSAVTVSGNTTAARGYGNDATQTVALAANTLNTTASNVGMTGGTTGADNDGNVIAQGNVTVVNLQSSYGSSLTVSNENSQIGLGVDSRETLPGQTRALIADSTLTADANTQEAVALGSRGTNALSLDGNTVGGGAGIASVQVVDSTSPISSTLSGSSVGAIAATHVENSSLAVTGNVQRAIGYGTVAGNDLSVAANGVNITNAVAESILVPYDGSGQPFHVPPSASAIEGVQPRVAAAFGVLSDQTLESTVATEASANLIGLNINGDLTGSSTTNDGNALIAAGYGLDATNRVALDVGTLDTGTSTDPFLVGQLANTQAVAGETAGVSAIVSGGNLTAPAAGNVVTSFVEDTLTNATVTTSANQVQAIATGSGANNALDVTANTINATSGEPVLGLGEGFLVNRTAFALTNAQSGEGSVTASLAGDPTSPVASASISTVLGATGDPGANPAPTVNSITGSSVISANNVLTAEGTSNRANNTLSIAANDVTADSGLQNFQVAKADITTVIGAEGTPPATGGAFTFTVQGESLNFDGTSSPAQFTAGTLFIELSSFGGTADQAAAVAALTGPGGGWTQVGNRLERDASDFELVFGRDPTGTDSDALQDPTTGGPGLGIAESGTASDFPGSPATGGVSIATLGGTITDSTLSVADNRVNGAVTGNTAANTLSVEAATIATTGTAVPEAAVGLVGLSQMNVPGVDHAVVSEQRVGTDPATSETLNSEVYGAFTIDTPALDLAATPTPDNVTISGSSLDVAGNSVRATSVGNVSDNAVNLEGNAITATSALVSRQSGIADIDATAGMDVRAPAAVGTSSVDMSSNTNTALGVLNDATNAASVSGTSVNTVASTAENADLGYTSGGPDPFSTINADHMVQNTQQAGTGPTATVTSAATTSIANNETAATATNGLVDSTLIANGNATYSEASANRATNSLTLNGDASLSATGGVSNRQNSFATVEASATSSLNLTLTGDASATPNATGALSGSTVSVEGNSTEALARANRAVNTLNAVAGAGYAASAAGAGAGVVPGSGTQSETVTADATYAVLNVQTNAAEAPVSARSENAVYRIALNADAGGDPSVRNGSVSLAGNRVTAQALGNSAENRISLAGLNTGSPTAAIGSVQANLSAISATVSGAQMAMTSTSLTGGTTLGGGATGSSLGVTGNSVSASATGNSVSNAIARVSR